MKTCQEAASSLAEHLGRPSWLTTVGAGNNEIILYLRTRWHPDLPCLENGWEKYPVYTKFFGEFAPIGEVP